MAAALVVASLLSSPEVLASPGGAAPRVSPQAAFADAPARLDALASRQFPASYGGLVVSGGGKHVVVYLTQPTVAVERALAAGAPAGTVTFVSTRNSLRFLDSLQQTILGRAQALTSSGIKLVEFGPDIRTGREYVGVQGLTAKGAAVLDRWLGARNLELTNLSTDQVPVATVGRATDSAPWNAGDYIANQSHSAGCSSGFGIFFGVSSVPGNFTASHCFATGTGIYNYAAGEGHGSNTRMGYISNRDTSSGGTDTEILDTINHGGSSDLVWLGSPTSTTRGIVSGYTTNPVGDQICNSGAYSGEVCGAAITNNNTCITVDGIWRCHMIHAVNSSHAIANETGDSGGPVFRFIGSSLYATGIVSASTTADQRSCQYNTNQICFWDIYYTAINSALSEYGARIIT
jgi:hypothetical protein